MVCVDRPCHPPARHVPYLHPRRSFRGDLFPHVTDSTHQGPNGQTLVTTYTGTFSGGYLKLKQTRQGRRPGCKNGKAGWTKRFQLTAGGERMSAGLADCCNRSRPTN
jgi:hypothetical protein